MSWYRIARTLPTEREKWPSELSPEINLYPSSKLETIFSNSTSSADNTITVIAQTPSGNSKKLVVKLSQLVLIKKEEFEASLTEIKQESFVPPPPSTTPSEEDLKLADLKVSKTETKNFEFDRKYVVLDPQINEKYSDNKDTVTFRCEICEKQFTTSSRYQKHLISHSSDDQHTCSLCGKVFRSLAMLLKHEDSHQVARFVCEFCKKELASKHQLDIHIRRHKGEYSDKCAECGKEYYNRKAFRQHIESEHKGIRYTCPICGSILKNRRYWKDHMTKHTHPDIKRYLCQICNKFYSSKTALNGHMKIHSAERYECNICGKKSTQKAAHLVHMRLHTGEKNFVCEICGKNFVRKDMMQIHKRRVHELSKYQCEYCQQQFETAHHLLVHYHSHEEVQKNFACEICPKKFIDANFLRNHVNKVHIENKPDDVTSLKSSPKIKKRDQEKIRCLHCDKFILKSEVKSHQCTNKMDNIEFKSLMDYSFEKFEDVVPYEYDTHNEIACVGDGSIMYEFKDDIINSDGIVEVCGANEDVERFVNTSKAFAPTT